jgi:hypothetical protein
MSWSLTFVHTRLYVIFSAVRFHTFTDTNRIIVVTCIQDTVEWEVVVIPFLGGYRNEVVALDRHSTWISAWAGPKTLRMS